MILLACFVCILSIPPALIRKCCFQEMSFPCRAQEEISFCLWQAWEKDEKDIRLRVKSG